MNIAIRLFLGYFLIVGVAAWFVISIFAKEVEPGVRQATEETLVDTANILAELAADDLASGKIAKGRFAAAVNEALQRKPNALIWGVTKASVDARIHVTDSKGVVVFDSAGVSVSADFSQWRDVARVLRGEYGARSTRDDPADPQSSSMYVAAPVMRQGTLIGVLSVSKPTATLMPYAERARDRVMRAGLVLLAISAVIGLAFTLWLTWSLNRLRDYALAVADGEKVTAPVVGGRQLSVLARSLASMRERLDGKQYVENYVQSLAHELKSPLTAVRAAAELLQEDPSAADRQHFASNIAEQAERMRLIIERLLALARVEQLQAPEERREIDLAALVRTTLDSRADQLAARRLTVGIDLAPPNPAPIPVTDARSLLPGRTATADFSNRAIMVTGDPFLLQQALGNLIDNAIAFSAEGGEITVRIGAANPLCEVSVRDRGPGVPDYALPHLFERFYSLPRPATGRKSTGLGLAFVREVAKVHGGHADIANHPEGGALARLVLPVA